MFCRPFHRIITTSPPRLSLTQALIFNQSLSGHLGTDSGQQVKSISFPVTTFFKSNEPKNKHTTRKKNTLNLKIRASSCFYVVIEIQTWLSRLCGTAVEFYWQTLKGVAGIQSTAPGKTAPLSRSSFYRYNCSLSGARFSKHIPSLLIMNGRPAHVTPHVWHSGVQEMPLLKVSLHYLFTYSGGLTHTCNEELSHGLLQIAAKCQPHSWIAARPHRTYMALFASSSLTLKTLSFLNSASINTKLFPVNASANTVAQIVSRLSGTWHCITCELLRVYKYLRGRESKALIYFSSFVQNKWFYSVSIFKAVRWNLIGLHVNSMVIVYGRSLQCQNCAPVN